MKPHIKTTIPLVLIVTILLITSLPKPSSALQISETLDQNIKSTGENIPANFTATQITQWINNETIYVRSPDAKNDTFYKTLNLTTYGFNTTKITLNFTDIQPQNLTKVIEWINPQYSPTVDYSLVTPRTMSFRVPSSCNITMFNVSIYTPTGLSVNLTWKIMNSTGVLPYPSEVLRNGNLYVNFGGCNLKECYNSD